jgi:RND family efflux transporter MFP subunit
VATTLTGEIQPACRPPFVSGALRVVGFGPRYAETSWSGRSAEQQADLNAATAAVAAADLAAGRRPLTDKACCRAASRRARTTTRTSNCERHKARRIGAELGRTREALGDTELRAGAAGVITARSLELGQVVQAAQSVFSLAQDGERDAIFDVPESMFFADVEHSHVSLALVSDAHVSASGYLREISPAVDPKSSAVRVKVAIQNPPPAMTLGNAIAGTAGTKSTAEITLPWTALTAAGSKPAVWIVDPKTNTASLKPVTVGAYEAGAVLIKHGIEPGDRVVIDGGKLLSSGQPVTYGEDRS